MIERTNLSERQKEIVRLLCNGFTTVEIANVLHISNRTAAHYKTVIYPVLNVKNQSELMRAALTLGIINVNELITGSKEEREMRRVYANQN